MADVIARKHWTRVPIVRHLELFARMTFASRSTIVMATKSAFNPFPRIPNAKSIESSRVESMPSPIHSMRSDHRKFRELHSEIEMAFLRLFPCFLLFHFVVMFLLFPSFSLFLFQQIDRIANENTWMKVDFSFFGHCANIFRHIFRNSEKKWKNNFPFCLTGKQIWCFGNENKPKIGFPLELPLNANDRGLVSTYIYSRWTWFRPFFVHLPGHPVERRLSQSSNSPKSKFPLRSPTKTVPLHS